MKVNLSLIAIGLVIGPMLAAPDQFAQTINAASATRADQQAVNRREADAITRATRELSASQVALARVQAACVSVVDKGTGEVYRLVEHEPVFVAEGADRVLDNGTLVCNSLGDTGEIWDGVVRHIARVAPADKAKYQQLFNQQFGK